MKLKVSAGSGPPAGSYVARFEGVEQTQHETYGEGLRWKFKVLQGPQAGQLASRTTGLKPSAKNGCGKVLAGLVGRALDLDEEIDIVQYVGRTYLIVVQAGEKGGTRVEAVIAAPTS